MRLGVIGTAHWAELVHLPGFARHPEVDLVGVYGRNPERCRELAGAFAIESFESVAALLSAVDAVSFVVPPAVQEDLAQHALQAGKHVLLEKPVATDLEKAVALDRVAEQQGVVALCFLTRMYVPAVTAFIDRLAQEKPRAARAEFRSGALLEGSPYHSSAWRQEERGALWDATPHCLSVLVGCCGPIEAISAAMPRAGQVILEAHHRGGGLSTAEIDLRDATTSLTETYTVETPAGAKRLADFPYDRQEAFGIAIDTFIERIARPEATPRSTDLALAIHLVAVLAAANASLDAGGDIAAVAAAH